MAGYQIFPVLVVLCATVALSYASTLPRDIIFPTVNGNPVENSESIDYPPSVNDQHLGISDQEDKPPKGCFHFYVSRNMSSLLAEATKMLRRIRDRREREWILTFIYRIKSLAEHLRAHPDSRNYDCLPTDEETKKRILSDNVKGQQQPELYFVDDVPKRSSEGEEPPEKPIEKKQSNDNQEPINTSEPAGDNPESNIPSDQEADPKPPSSKFQTESSAEIASDSTLTRADDGHKDVILSKQDMTTSVQDEVSDQTPEDKDAPAKREENVDNSLIISSLPDCDSPPECRNLQPIPSYQMSPESYFADAGNIYPMYQSNDAVEPEASELYQREVLKERIRKALLEELAPEIKKLRTVGGTENDLMNIWNSNFVQEGVDKSAEQNEETDFDYEETGAAAGDLNLNEKAQPDRTVAPSLDEVQNSKENSNIKDSSYEPYDDSDVLVQQLFDVRYSNPPSKTTKSLNDQNNDYLITSTHVPY